METPRPGPEKLGAVREDPDLIGLLFRLIWRVTSGRQEHAPQSWLPGGNRRREGVNPFRSSRHCGAVRFGPCCIRYHTVFCLK